MNNIHNKLISKSSLNDIINKHLSKAVSIKEIDLYRKAFMHKSFGITDIYTEKEDSCCMFNMSSKDTSNERLEFFGDSCINFITAEYLFDRYPSKNEGFLTKLRTKLVRNTQLAFLGDKLGFREWLLISPHVEKIMGRTNDRLIEDVFESFIAALYKDLGFLITRDFVYSCYNTYIDIEKLSETNDNYKDILLRFFQVNNWNYPVYYVIETGTKQNREFTSFLLLKNEYANNSKLFYKLIETNTRLRHEYRIENDDSMVVEFGIGKTKKESEQNVSKKSMKFFNIPSNY